jgi:hypothetical protein
MRKRKRQGALLRVIIILVILAAAGLLAYAMVRGGGRPDFSFLAGGEEPAEAANGVFYFDSGRRRSARIFDAALCGVLHHRLRCSPLRPRSWTNRSSPNKPCHRDRRCLRRRIRPGGTDAPGVIRLRILWR